LATEVDTNGSITNLDLFAEAISAAEQVGAQLTSFVANPSDVLTLSKIKKLTGSTEPLLNVDPTQPTRKQILGVPLISSPAVQAGHIWGIPQAKVFTVLRDDVKLVVDRSYAFNRDAVAVRVTARVAFGFPHEAAVIHLYNAGS
jgi:HK97 family phage major capsid protein